MSNHDGCRRMWLSVAFAVLKDDNGRIEAARAGRRSWAAPGESVTAVRTVDEAIRIAKAYYNSKDWRMICHMAGISYRPEAAIAFVTGGPRSMHLARVKVLTDGEMK